MFELAEYIGIIAFAMSGFFVASRANLDLLGVLISTFLTALGGGIIRDISVDTTPFTFSHNYPGIIVLSVMIILILFKFHRRKSIENKLLFILSDSIGLISFSISGALIALEFKLNFTGVLAISFITAVGGGIVRDVIINEVPFVFKSGFYGTVALLMASCVYIFDMLNLINIASLTTLFTFGVILRLIAFYKKWSIPLK
ncbi:MAG: TRIC cation channel family protein [Thiovulaceae bacterium]|nr:TRIC cation channel family protein [Sulfurimonadaceae bacterium]MCW9026945.1 TRIC cation channel family protein [Sulfurimonadaceae bacterium]